MDNQTFPGLTGNQLKLLALIAMTADHVGLVLLPQFPVLRIIGRLAFPIYAYMIAEGCRHTHSKGRYLAVMASFAAVCQLFYYFALGSLYQSVLVTFALAIAVICLPDLLRCSHSVSILLWILGILTVLFLCEGLPLLLTGTDYRVDYGFIGALIPVLVYAGTSRRIRLVLLTLGLVGLSMYYGGNQWWCLTAVPLLALYNEQRGKARMKYLFYIYYPTHLVVIYLLGMIL